MPQKITAAARRVIDEVRRLPTTRVKVAVTDIDGVLRGKYLHKDKFLSAAESGFGFCSVVFGWDANDAPYDNTVWTAGIRLPDATVQLPSPPSGACPDAGAVFLAIRRPSARGCGRPAPFIKRGSRGREAWLRGLTGLGTNVHLRETRRAWQPSITSRRGRSPGRFVSLTRPSEPALLPGVMES